jgi:transcriptional regulator with XRE-family HTH domain
MAKLTQVERRVAARVREARNKAGLSQGDLAEVLDLSVAGFGHYDRGRQPYSVDMLFKLAPVLGRSVEWLLGLDTSLTDEEDRLLTAFRVLDDPVVREVVLGLVQDHARIARAREG